jgi:hypothetical protein
MSVIVYAAVVDGGGVLVFVLRHWKDYHGNSRLAVL